MENHKIRNKFKIPKKIWKNQTIVNYINELVEIFKEHTKFTEWKTTRHIIKNLKDPIVKYWQLLKIRTIKELIEHVREYERVEWEIELIHCFLIINA